MSALDDLRKKGENIGFIEMSDLEFWILKSDDEGIAAEYAALRADISRLVALIHAAPNPHDMTDSEVAKAYLFWYYGDRINRMTSEEMRMK